MKRITAIFIIFVLIFSCTISLSAAESDFTKETAEKLLIEGYQRMMLVYYGNIDEYSGEDAYKYLKADTIKGEAVLKVGTLTYTTSAKGEKYYYELSDEQQ